MISGGSAGAIILGKTIDSAGYLGDRNDLGLTETGGLDLLRGYSVWPHYEDAHAEIIARFVGEHRHPVIALSERAGAIVQDTTLEVVGYDSVYLFHGVKRIVVPPAATYSLDLPLD